VLLKWSDLQYPEWENSLRKKIQHFLLSTSVFELRSVIENTSTTLAVPVTQSHVLLRRASASRSRVKVCRFFKT
jgi:hypothetical protein